VVTSGGKNGTCYTKYRLWYLLQMALITKNFISGKNAQTMEADQRELVPKAMVSAASVSLKLAHKCNALNDIFAKHCFLFSYNWLWRDKCWKYHLLWSHCCQGGPMQCQNLQIQCQHLPGFYNLFFFMNQSSFWSIGPELSRVLQIKMYSHLVIHFRYCSLQSLHLSELWKKCIFLSR